MVRRLLCLLGLALMGCVPVSSGDSSVVLTEFEVSVAQRLGPGEHNLQVINRGAFGHTLVVSTADGTVVGSTQVLAPGAATSLTLDLEPGRYQFSCRIVVQIPDGSIVDHYAEGMSAPVTVSAP